MKSYRENITAGQPLQMSLGGRILYIKSSSAGPVLSVEFFRQAAISNKIEYIGKGSRFAPVSGFDGIKIASSVDSVVDFIVSDGTIDFAFDEDDQIIGNTDAQSIPIKTPAGQPLEVTFAGIVAPVFGTATVDNTNANPVPTVEKLAATVTDLAAVAVTAVAGVLIAAGVTRRGLRIKNAGANPVAIGGATLAFATAAVLIQAGETWIENEAPGAAWFCQCGPALASTLYIQEII